MNGMQPLPSWQDPFGNPSGARLGTLVNAINIVVLVSVLFSSQLCEIFGRKKPITLGTLLITLGPALQARAQELGMFIAGRLIIGVSTGNVAVAAPHLMTDVAFKDRIIVYDTLGRGVPSRSVDDVWDIQDGIFVELEVNRSSTGSTGYRD
ncbi:hypothetical protein BJX62DRAFT_245841 [Aspergillus germanicus]